MNFLKGARRDAFGGGDAEPADGAIVRITTFGNRRCVGKESKALTGSNRQGAKISGLNMRQRRSDDVKHHLHVTREQVLKGRPVTPVGDVGHLDVGGKLERLHGYVEQIANPRRSIVQTITILTGIGDELGQSICRDAFGCTTITRGTSVTMVSGLKSRGS